MHRFQDDFFCDFQKTVLEFAAEHKVQLFTAGSNFDEKKYRQQEHDAERFCDRNQIAGKGNGGFLNKRAHFQLAPNIFEKSFIFIKLDLEGVGKYFINRIEFRLVIRILIEKGRKASAEYR